MSCAVPTCTGDGIDPTGTSTPGSGVVPTTVTSKVGRGSGGWDWPSCGGEAAIVAGCGAAAPTPGCKARTAVAAAQANQPGRLYPECQRVCANTRRPDSWPLVLITPVAG